MKLSIDFETASQVDLKKTGAAKYSRHPSTRVLCMSYRFDNLPVLRWKPGEAFPQDVLDHVFRGGKVHGWNVGFELQIWNNTLINMLPDSFTTLLISQCVDTMAAAAYWGLPLSLAAAGPASGIGVTKDDAGHRLMMQMCKPRAVTAAGVTWWHLDDPSKLQRLQDYCDQDVVVESAISDVIPPLPDIEQTYWEMDQRMNSRGVGIDFDLVAQLQVLARHAAGNANAIMSVITLGQVPTITSTAKLLAFVQSVGYPHADLKKDTVEARLEALDCTGVERECLELRAETAKTSAAKLTAMQSAGDSDTGIGRVYGALQFFGASRTGRWAGRLIQMQNMPRGSVKLIAEAIKMVRAGAPPEVLEMFFGPIMGIVSSALRGCMVPRAGHQIISADFSQIEARVIAWLAGQQDILDVFERGEDVYVYTAKLNGSDNRQLGKVLVLACGFGMSAPKFKDTAETYKLYLSTAAAELAVKNWRTANYKIVEFWWACDNAAKHVLEDHTRIIEVGPVTFGMWHGHLLIKLPSGHKLVYRNASLQPDALGRIGITYWGIDQYTRQWSRQRTYGGKLAENITQAVARDMMAEATLAVERQGIPVELLVHDEMLAEAPDDDAQRMMDQMLSIMRTPPKWGRGLPVDAAGWFGERYKK